MDIQGKKVFLLVEDDKALNRAVVFKLQQKGHVVISTTTAEEALAVLKDHYKEIDIVWLDILLPGMNGLEFLELLRKQPEYKDLKVVICSVSERIGKGTSIVELGVLSSLIKSDYTIEDLVEKIASFA